MVRLTVTSLIEKAPAWGSFLNRLVKKAAGKLNWRQLDLSLVFVTPRKIKNLNKKYRKKNQLTDVLSFEELNEIVICLAQAKKQAKLHQVSLKQEVSLLVVHGLLHLKGFDHHTQADWQKMNRLQQQILEEIGFNKPVVY